MATRNRLARHDRQSFRALRQCSFRAACPLFISPLFFEDKDPVTALILTYFMIPIGLITQPDWFSIFWMDRG